MAVIVYLLLERQTFNGLLIKGYWYTKLYCIMYIDNHYNPFFFLLILQSFEMSDEFSTTRLYVGNLEAPSQDSTGQDDTEAGIHLFI